MLNLDPELVDLLQTSHKAEYRAYAFYDGQSRGEVPLAERGGTLNFNGDQVIQCSGNVFLAKDSDSLIPKGKGDVLAPYGQEVRIDRIDRKGNQEWATTIGQLRIEKVPSMREYFKFYPSRAQVIGWSAQIDLQDRFAKIEGNDFVYPDYPRPESLGSTWKEIQRVAEMPIVVSDLLPDQTIPSSLTAYDDKRMNTLTTLFANLGGVPHMTRLGTLTGRPKDTWLTATEPVFTFEGVIDMDDSLTSELYNCVKVSSSVGGNDMFVVREILDPGDPLRVTGPYGRRVYKISSPLWDTQQKLADAADSILARVSTRQSKIVKITALPQPHLELGDYVRAQEKAGGIITREVDGEITKITAPLTPTSAWTYELAAAEIR
ncbi:hypothetical protein [Herbiconiux solani]|uniref:hypothetical protein n=1 Tax=Herbiconiux solani TaxID=661329 RepID=UPI000824D129|nr:hypothetical protein [Herbiconiux solani]